MFLRHKCQKIINGKISKDNSSVDTVSNSKRDMCNKKHVPNLQYFNVLTCKRHTPKPVRSLNKYFRTGEGYWEKQNSTRICRAHSRGITNINCK